MIKVLRFFFGSSRNGSRSLWLLGFIVLTGLVGGVSNMGILATLNKVLSGNHPERESLLWQILIFCLLTAGCRAISQISLTKYAIGIALDMRVEICKQILAAPLKIQEDIGLPRLLASFTENVPTVTTAITALPTFCLNLALCCACIAYMAWLSWELILPVVVCAAAGIFGYRWISRKARSTFSEAHGIYVRLLGNFRAMVEGTKELKLHSAKLRDFVEHEIKNTTKLMAGHRFRSAIYYTIADTWSSIFGFVVIGVLIFFYVGRETQAHSATATGYVLAFLLLTPALQAMTSTLPTLGQASVALDKIEALQAELTLAKQSSFGPLDECRLPRRWEKLSLSRATHTYRNEADDEVFTLGPVDLEISQGELVFITGGNGSGKTTLVKLLMGLYEPMSGEIRLDGVAFDDSTREEYRQLFSAVLSDFYLFDRLLGFDGPAELVQDYLVRLKLEKKVTVAENRLSTTRLSQGQRKRLALLVAYLEDRPIYVFDEWASDQDAVFRNVFYNEILVDLRQKGKTVLVISHDERYYDLADRVIKLEYGQVVDAGLRSHLGEPLAGASALERY